MQAPNSYATGGGGSDFERRVAASFVCSALAGVPLRPLSGPIAKVWLQAAHLNCGLEDVVLEGPGGDESPQRVFVSVKSTISPRTSDPEFAEVISKAWNDWQAGAVFKQSRDFFLLVAATSRSPRIHFFGRLTELARSSVGGSDFEKRLSIDGYHHATVRDLLPEVVGIIEKETQAEPDRENLHQFLRSFYVSTFDFDQPASQDASRVIGLLRLASETRDANAAAACWNAVIEKVSQGAPNAKCFNEAELADFSRQHRLKTDTSSRIRTWLANLRAHCRITRSGISSSLSNHRHVIRQVPLEELSGLIPDTQSILVSGPAGSGKSALAIEAAEKFAKPENIFCFNSDELAHPHLDAALQAVGLRDLNAEEWAGSLPFEPRVLLIESIERLLQSGGSREAFDQLLRLVSADGQWRVIVTCRDYLADHVRDAWITPGGWKTVGVPLLTEPELKEAIADSGIPDVWLHQPTVRDALRNLKWLDLTIRAAQQMRGDAPVSAWATLADWRGFVWRQLLSPDVDPRGQELLVRIGMLRATTGAVWIPVEAASLMIADQLKAQGILRKNEIFADQYRPEHDLLEDWALIFHVRREFAAHAHQPAELIARLGTNLMVRRAFRQFLGELLESDKSGEAVNFIRQVFTTTASPKEWREEVVIALLGSSRASDALLQTRDFWIDASGEGLQMLCHLLCIAYRSKQQADSELEYPIGPGWNAVLTFIHKQGDAFLRKHTRAVTGLLLDWRHAVTPENPVPAGLSVAALLVKGLWQIATEGTERFEKYWGNEDRHHLSADANRLCWLVAAVAGALDPRFFRDVAREVFDERSHDGRMAWSEEKRQCRELIEFLVADHAGWTLAHAHPRTMVRLCLRAYGLNKERAVTNPRHYRRGRDCGLRADNHDFTPPSALRGPFLELLRHSPRLGAAFILKLVNEAAYRWVEALEPDHLFLEQPFEVVLKVDGKAITQIADQGWWRCYRGWSPYPHVIECALMALEKWLLEEVGARDVENLQATLLQLIARSNNVAVTAVAAAVGGVYWWHCGKLAATLVECGALLRLDRERWLNDQTQSGWGGGWSAKDAFYLKERRESNPLPHRQEHLEQFILKAQLGSGRSEIWPVLDQINAELAVVPTEQVTEAVQTARLILHRIDSRNLRIKRHADKPGQIELHPAPPPPELQKHLDESGKDLETTWLPMNMQMWATRSFEPSARAKPQPERWREMLEKARQLSQAPVDTEGMMLFGYAPTMVAAVCLRDFLPELTDDELDWCITQMTGMLRQQSEQTSWQGGSVLTGWQGECAAARVCGILSATRPARIVNMAAVDEATAIALSHPEKEVRLAAAEGIGHSSSDSIIQLSACELLISYSRHCREADLRHRGPLRLAHEEVNTWQDLSTSIHEEILTGARSLREKFVKGAQPDLRRLELFYPRGQEEEQSLPHILAALLHHKSKTAAAVFERARNWLVIQLIDQSDHGFGRRKYASDSWRDQYGSHSRSDCVNAGEVGRLLASRVLAMPPAEVRRFYEPVFRPRCICHLRDKAGTFLKDICLMLEDQDPAAFWAAWEVCLVTAAELGSELNNKEQWHKLGVSPQAASETFSALVSATFLNDMYFKPDQQWRPLDGETGRFTNAFIGFHVYAVDNFITFLDTVGGALLPGALRDVSNCLKKLVQLTGKTFLRADTQTRLMRLIAKEAALHRIPDEDRQTWQVILHLLDVLANAGFAEAFRLRESFSHFSQTQTT